MKKQFTKIAAFLMALVLCFTLFPANAQAASKVKLNKSKVTIYTGGSVTLKVIGTTRKVRFSSNRKSVATVNSKGKVTAKKAGTAVIIAKVGSKKMTCRVTVKKENLKLDRSRLTLYTGGSRTLKVTGTSRKVSFSTSKKSVATVSSKGKMTARKAGTALITARVGSRKVTCKVTVKKENLKLDRSSLTLTVGSSKTLKVTGTSRKVSFSTSNKSVATVSSSGKVTAKKAGTATITAKVGSKKVSCKVTVKEKIPAGITAVSIYWNGEKTIKATGAVGTVEWESSRNSIVTVKSAGANTAVLAGKKVGTATITAKTGGKVFKKYFVTVKMKTSPVTEKEEDLMDWAVLKYEDWNTLTGDSTLRKLGLTREHEAKNLWNTHKRALVSTRKLLPGRDVHIIDVDSLKKCWAKQDELKAKGVRYYRLGGISHDHGKIKKWAVAWIE